MGFIGSIEVNIKEKANRGPFQLKRISPQGHIEVLVHNIPTFDEANDMRRDYIACGFGEILITPEDD